MSEAGDLLKRLNETMVPGNEPSQDQAGAVDGVGDDPIPDLTDIDQSGLGKGKQSGRLWLQERPESEWEAYDLGDMNQASDTMRELKGKPLSHVRSELQKRMGANIDKRGGSFER